MRRARAPSLRSEVWTSPQHMRTRSRCVLLRSPGSLAFSVCRTIHSGLTVSASQCRSVSRELSTWSRRSGLGPGCAWGSHKHLRDSPPMHLCELCHQKTMSQYCKISRENVLQRPRTALRALWASY